MSADNAIYIRPLKNGKFAVKCISSFYHEEYTDEEIDKDFMGQKEFDTLEQAWDEEERIQDEWDKGGSYIEYGSEVIERKNLIFGGSNLQ